MTTKFTEQEVAQLGILAGDIPDAAVYIQDRRSYRGDHHGENQRRLDDFDRGFPLQSRRVYTGRAGDRQTSRIPIALGPCLAWFAARLPERHNPRIMSTGCRDGDLEAYLATNSRYSPRARPCRPEIRLLPRKDHAETVRLAVDHPSVAPMILETPWGSPGELQQRIAAALRGKARPDLIIHDNLPAPIPPVDLARIMAASGDVVRCIAIVKGKATLQALKAAFPVHVLQEEAASKPRIATDTFVASNFPPHSRPIYRRPPKRRHKLRKNA